METSHAKWLGLVLLAILFLATALYGWRLSPAANINRRFATQTLVLTWWATGVAGAHGGHAIDIWGRWAFTAACFMPATFFRFALVFPTTNYVPSTLLRQLIYGFGGVLALAAAFTPWVAHSYRVDTSGVLTRTAGPLMTLFVGYYVIAATVIFGIYVRKWRSARGIARVQLRLYCCGFLLFCLGGIASNMALPVLVGDSRYGALGPCFVMLFLAFLAHGIIRHRLMNTRLVIHNWLGVSIASVASVAPLLIIASHLEIVGSGEEGYPWRLGLVVASGLLAPPLWIATRRIVQRYGQRDHRRFQTLISNASGRLSQVLSSTEAAAVVTDTVTIAFRPQGVAIYVRRSMTDGPFERKHYASDGRNFSAPAVLPESVRAAAMSSMVIASPDYITYDGRSLTNYDGLALLEPGWAAMFPLMSEGELLAILIIGAKESHAPYYREDIHLLRILTSQATVAFKNSDLYERVLFANKYIENIVATVQSGIVAIDTQNNIRLLNHAANTLLGLPDDFVPARLLARTLPESVVAVLRETIATDVPSRAVEISIVRDGSETYVMCCAAPLRGVDGNIVGAVASLSDLSALKQLEIERTRAERLNYFEALAAALAHEIANPIVPIKVMTQLLARRHKDSDFIEEFVRTVGREVSRIETLVERLNSLSAPASRRISQITLQEVIRQMTRLVQGLYEEQRVFLNVQLEPCAMVVLGEEGELEELFLNLLTNALEATPAGGSVYIQGTRESHEAIIVIRDTGGGIPDHLAGQIFEPFISSKNRGSGLGLAICHGIVKRHQGEILAANADGGAIFTVRLPLCIHPLPREPDVS